MGRKRSNRYAHVRARCLERYGFELTRAQWGAWNHAVRLAVRAEPHDANTGVVIREIEHEGQKVMAMCSRRHVLTVVLRSHALRLWTRSIRQPKETT